MPRILLFLLLAILFFLSCTFAKADSANSSIAPLALQANEAAVVIGLGESVRLEVPDSTKMHISDGSVVRTRLMDRNVIMTGRKIGRTTLRLFGAKNSGDKTLVVTERKTATTLRLFQNLLRSKRGLHLSDDALPAIVVKGELLRLEDWTDLVSIARETKNSWRLEAQIFPTVRAAFAAKIENELKRLAWPGQRFSLGDRGPVLTGGIDSTGITADQKLGAMTLGIRLETSGGLTELEPMIRTKIVIAEVRKSKVRELGIKWPDVAQASLLPSPHLLDDSLMIGLHAIEDSGDGQILAMPTLLCRSGGEAKFLAGGEIPIKLQSFSTSQVIWKPYGITLHVQPKADRMKRMRFQLRTEISTLDTANAVDKVPGLLTNLIETQFNLNGPQTIVLSGLIKKEDGDSSNGIPLLRSIPILGSLFGSEKFQKRLTELLIFVTPEVVIPDGGVTDDDL